MMVDIELFHPPINATKLTIVITTKSKSSERNTYLKCNLATSGIRHQVHDKQSHEAAHIEDGLDGISRPLLITIELQLSRKGELLN